MFGRRRFLSFPLVIGAVVCAGEILDAGFTLYMNLLFQLIGMVSGKAIFGPPLEDYWKKKLQEEAAAKDNKQASSS